MYILQCSTCMLVVPLRGYTLIVITIIEGAPLSHPKGFVVTNTLSPRRKPWPFGKGCLHSPTVHSKESSYCVPNGKLREEQRELCYTCAVNCLVLLSTFAPHTPTMGPYLYLNPSPNTMVWPADWMLNHWSLPASWKTPYVMLTAPPEDT